MGCPSCGAENPSGARFCNNCGAPQAAACPDCGNANPPGSRFCNACGSPLAAAPASLPAESPPSPQSYTPRHLAEKILASRAALEGERKQVTVLFADVVGSTELIQDRDPEEAQRLLDGIVQIMMDAVHRYEGTVSRLMGDGLMAMFGAPVAHEDHAVRACFAALAMLETVRAHAEELRQSHGTDIQIRVGVNSGEVIVRLISDDLHMDYTAMGQTVHLASRLEGLAASGTGLMSTATRALVEGLIDVRPLGPVAVKGLEQPLSVYELVRIGAARTRLQAAAAHGLTPFVGRDDERAVVERALARACGGQGEVVALVGEAGVGKSRLVYEVTRALEGGGWSILQTGAASYGKSVPYQPIVNLLRAYARIEAGDDARTMIERLGSRVQLLDRTLDTILPPLLALLDLPVTDSGWASMDPRRRRRATLDAVRQLLLSESQSQPLLLVFEDLHWIDSASQALLDELVDSLPTARLLLLVNFRPEYTHQWGNRSSFTQIRIDPLPASSADALLGSLLGGDSTLAPLKRHLIERTEGVPFFLEETVRSLVETGAVVGQRGTYKLVQDLTDIRIPVSVQVTLAARIDRLEPELKRLLQTAAVIGKDVPYALLQAIADTPDEALGAALGRLQGADLIHTVKLFPEPEYAFKHALTHEVAYESLLLSRRRELHALVARAVERLYSDRLDELAATLAHHLERARDIRRAVPYFVRAGDRAAATYANVDAVSFYGAALGHLDAEQPAGGDGGMQSVKLASEILEKLGDVQELMGRHEDARASYLRAVDLKAEPLEQALLQRKVGATWSSQHLYAAALDAYRAAESLLGSEPPESEDRSWWQAWLLVMFDRMAIHYWLAQVDEITALAEIVRPAVERHGTPSQRGDFYQRLALIGLRRERYIPSDRTLEHARAALTAVRETDRGGDIAVAQFLVGFCHLWRGEIDDAWREIEAAFETAERTGDITHQSRCLTYLTIAARKQGRVDVVRGLASRSLAAATAGEMLEYIGTAHANAAWVAWREGEYAAARVEGEAAFEAWHNLPATHASGAFQWTALWPLIGIAVAEARADAAVALARRLLLAEQQPPPDAILEALSHAVLAADDDQGDTALARLSRAADLAKRLGYL